MAGRHSAGGSTGDRDPILMEQRFSSELQITVTDHDNCDGIPAEAPGMGSPRVETPEMGSHRAETSVMSSPRKGSPRRCSPRAETPGMESPGRGFPRAETPGMGSPGTGSPRAETPGADDGLLSPQQVVLSTQSAAALKRGMQQLIPKSLASLTTATGRPKNRHHTTVVTFPVGREDAAPPAATSRGRHLTQVVDVSWDDYDSDGDGFSLRRNRRNMSYRAAVTTLDMDALGGRNGELGALETVREGAASGGATPTRGESRSTEKRQRRTLGRKRNQKHAGSFKDAPPRLYQEIRERGLHSTNQDELLDDFVVVTPPAEDQGIVVKSYRPAQLTWSQLPQVKDAGILEKISPEERKRQEAIFEIITSEYSYLHSLEVLVRHFKESEVLRKTMTTTEHHHLFSNIAVIHGISKRFFEDLERRHQDNVVIRDISDIVQGHATRHFEPYIVYCSNETFQQRTLQKLLSTNTTFKETLKQIECSSECGCLPMISFLILPMQRVTRLPLLLDTICQKTPDKTAEYFAAVWALHAMSKVGVLHDKWYKWYQVADNIRGSFKEAILEKLVNSCNDGARRMERTEQMYTIQKQMEFGKIKPFPLVSASRWLRKRGELVVSSEEMRIWRAFGPRSYYLFLFSDVLIVTRKKSEESFVVTDYATLENVEVEPGDDADSRGAKGLGLVFRLLMSKNSEGRAENFTLVAESSASRARWVSALRQHKEGIISHEGMPQYEVIKGYMPKEPDELGLQQAEVVIVMQKEDGWCHGERMRDGEGGWFPASCATEITNPTAMQNNVQRMKRLRKETNV